MMKKCKLKVVMFLALASLVNISVYSQDTNVFSNLVLSGTDSGLYKISKDKVATQIWSEGSVKKILKTDDAIFFLSSCGIITTKDLITFEKRNDGLPVNVIKKINNGEKNFVRELKDLKDLAIHPDNPLIMVTATKDAVYLTKDGGITWKNIGLNARTTGVKSLAVFNQNIYSNGEKIGSELVIYLSHAIYGFSYYRCDAKNPAWIDMETGFSNLPGQHLTEEIASMFVEKNTDGEYDLYMGSTFIPRIYKLNWQERKVEEIWNDGNRNSTQDCLIKFDNKFVFLGTDGFSAIDKTTKRTTNLPDQVYAWKELYSLCDKTNCLYIPKMRIASHNCNEVSLSELWLLEARRDGNKYYDKVRDIKGIYVPANHISDERLSKYFNIIKENDLNAIVVDMKDDKGLLRFDAKTPLVKELGTESSYAVKLDNFVSQCKEKNIYLIARIVVFKDRNLFRYGKGKYAVWDKVKNERWRGERGTIETKDEEGNVTGTEIDYYDEYWVDPYCQLVWEYNVAVAKELIERGFDEIQFDYIRFPTDGKNLSNARFRYYESGMDKESALISFLSYARENIDAPIGIDIYGSNGWYRSSARTGQDVELMSHYVDLICPMFYPSHFEQNFLDYAPAEDRPFRIYDFGSYRNTIIGRNRIIVRPWIQAFYLNCYYDRKYYNKTYVKKEIEGVKNTINDGYLFWNNIGRYDDIYPDEEKQN